MADGGVAPRSGLDRVRRRLIGRERELAELEALVADRARLVTVTGRSGVGKSHLAQELVARLSEDRPALVVDASGAASDGGVEALATALGVASLAGGSLLDGAVAHIGGRALLLVLDDAPPTDRLAEVADQLICRCPALTLLVTTPRPLRLRAEHVLRLEPLPVPPPEGTDPGAIARVPSVELYLDRARALAPGVTADLASVAELCRCLEGLPLAIELVAARVQVMPPEVALARLREDVLAAVGSSYRDVPVRHRSLSAAVSWTVAQLDEPARHLFDRLGIAAGSFDLEDAEALAGDLDVEALDAVEAMLDLQLVHPARRGPLGRFRLPPSIRALAQERLGSSDEGAAVAETWLDWCAARARRAAQALDAPHPMPSRSWLAASEPVLVHELGRALAHERAGPAVDLLSALLPHWDATGRFGAHAQEVEDGLALAQRAGLDGGAHTEVLAWAGALALAYLPGDGDGAAWCHLDAALERARASGDERSLLTALEQRALSVAAVGAMEEVAELTAEGLALAQRAGSEVWTARFEVFCGMVAHQRGELAAAATLGQRGLAAGRQVEDDATVVMAVMLLVPLRRQVPGLTVGLPELEEAAERARRAGQTKLLALLLNMAAAEARFAGDDPRARRWWLEGLRLARTLPVSPIAGHALLASVGMAVGLGRWREAALLHGAIVRHLPALEELMPPAYRSGYERQVRQLEHDLGPEGFADAVGLGAALDWAAGLDLALEVAEEAVAADEGAGAPALEPRWPAEDGRRGPAGPGDPLTPREHEVLALVAQGLGNKAIASTLGITAKTAMHHTSAIYRKLAVRGRSEAAAWAVRHGLAGEPPDRPGRL